MPKFYIGFPAIWLVAISSQSFGTRLRAINKEPTFLEDVRMNLICIGAHKITVNSPGAQPVKVRPKKFNRPEPLSCKFLQGVLNPPRVLRLF
jgi:hypothetical protein